jgi:hypothetical protein
MLLTIIGLVPVAFALNLDMTSEQTRRSFNRDTRA